MYDYNRSVDMGNLYGGFTTQAPWRSQISKIKSINIEEGITNVGRFAFHGVNKVTEVNIAKSVKTLNEGAFDRCHALTSVNFAENSELQSIGQSAFYWTENLKSITIPEKVKSIGKGGLGGTTSLREIILPDSSTAISNMFYNWDRISFNSKNITIKCAGELEKCKNNLKNAGLLNSFADILPTREDECNNLELYYYTGSTCDKIPTDLSKMTCNNGYVLDETAHRCNKIADCASFADGACVCDEGYYTKAGGCVSFEEGCGEGWLEKNRECIEASKGCGENYRDMGGFCNRIRYTPAEAAKVLNDNNNNSVTITFKK